MNIATGQTLFDIPLTYRQRAFLRAMREAGGSMRIVGAAELETARVCAAAGYASVVKTRDRAFLTPLGRAYLQRLARVE